MEPLERLLNLVALLLETRQPLTFDQIRATLEPYGQERQESAKRMFERDKDVLREYGVPLQLVDTDAWGTEQGYLIPKDAYYLPEIAFTPEESGALLVAAQSGGEDTTAAQGVRKLLYGMQGGVLAGLAGGPLAAGSDARSALVLAVASAVRDDRRVRFSYRTSRGETTERDVDAYAMLFRGGHWYLVGHDRTRDEVRAFRLSRFVSEPVDGGEGTGRPVDFRAADHVQAATWVASGEDRARVAFAPDVAWWATGSIPGSEVGPARTDGWVEVSIPIADDSALAGVILQFGPDAVVLEPDSLRDEVIGRLEASARA
jgi:proteasome accessory factor B